MLLSPLLEDVNWVNIVGVLLVVAILAIGWMVVQYFLKLTIKIFAFGCLGILALGLICAAVSYFSGQ